MVSYLSRCRIPIEIYHYDPAAVDDLYVNFKSILLRMTAEEIKEKTGLRANYVRAVVDALQNPSITQLGRLASIKGIGATTLERLFRFATQEFQQSDCTVHQPWLEL
jgi:hypothetical protein